MDPFDPLITHLCEWFEDLFLELDAEGRITLWRLLQREDVAGDFAVWCEESTDRVTGSHPEPPELLDLRGWPSEQLRRGLRLGVLLSREEGSTPALQGFAETVIEVFLVCRDERRNLARQAERN